jgi:hypothetical protein
MGGIVGNNTGGTITNALSVGVLKTGTTEANAVTVTSGATNVGAIAGNNSGSITDSYYDTRTYNTSVGTTIIPVQTVGDSTSALLGNSTTYTSANPSTAWNFTSVWTTEASSYPVLAFCAGSCAAPLRADPNNNNNNTNTNTTSSLFSAFGNFNQNLQQVLATEQATNTQEQLAEEIIYMPAGFTYISLGSVLAAPYMTVNQMGSGIEALMLDAGYTIEGINNTFIVQQYDGSTGISPDDLDIIVKDLINYYHEEKSKNGGHHE